MLQPDTPSATTTLLLPPYESLTPLTEAAECPTRGVAVIWKPTDATSQRSEWDWLADRPACVSLVIVLPPPAAIQPAVPLLRNASLLRPRGVLPNSALSDVEPIKLLLANGPRDLVSMAVAHFSHHGILRNQKVRALIAKIFELAPTSPSISKLARRMYTSRRTLGRYFDLNGLPVPSHWLQLARLLYVCALIQEKRDVPIFRAAVQLGYPDGFTMSNQMKRLIGCRPSDARDNLGLSWIIEEWLQRERAAGRLTVGAVEYGAAESVTRWVKRYPLRQIG